LTGRAHCGLTPLQAAASLGAAGVQVQRILEKVVEEVEAIEV
jgi:hypothetical protein